MGSLSSKVCFYNLESWSEGPAFFFFQWYFLPFSLYYFSFIHDHTCLKESVQKSSDMNGYILATYYNLFPEWT